MSSDLIDTILEAARVGESTDWEFKSAKGGFPRSFWETYSAMANSEGGVIVLGAKEREGIITLDGLSPELAAQHQKYFWDNINNRNTISTNLLGTQDVSTLEVRDGILLVFQIPRATRTHRPVYLGPNMFGNTFRRRHEGDYRISDADVRRMLADADEIPVDCQIVEGFGLDDLDLQSLTQYRQRLAVLRRDHPWLTLPDHEFLARIGGWRHDRRGSHKGLTLAGLLMFGTDEALRDPEGVAGYFVDYREKLDPAVRWTDRICPDGTWAPNLFQFYQRVWPKLSAGLPNPFRLEGAERREETPAHEALREAFVNSLIHADYRGIGGVVIERHLDRFVLENPGYLLISLEQYHRGGASECRNKALQKMFALIGRGEQAGSGADKIRTGWRHHHWRAPKLECREEPSRVQLVLPMVSLIPDATLSALKEQYGTRCIEQQLAPAQLQALATAYLEGEVSNTRLQELLLEHPAEITRILQGLCTLGLLESDNRRRWSKYRLHGNGPADPSRFDAIQTKDNSLRLSDSSLHLEESSSHTATDLLHNSYDSLHTDEWAELAVLAGRISQHRRSDPLEVRKVIVNLCRQRYLTAEQLAQLLNRNPDGLRNRYLSPLVSEGLLALRYPDTATCPNQAYTTPEGTDETATRDLSIVST